MGGWPDSGEGRYTDKIEFSEQFKLSKAIRVHKNFVEGLPATLIFLTVGGYILPLFACIVGFINVVTKLIFTLGYLKYRPTKQVLAINLGGMMPIYLLAVASVIQTIIFMF